MTELTSDDVQRIIADEKLTATANWFGPTGRPQSSAWIDRDGDGILRGLDADRDFRRAVHVPRPGQPVAGPAAQFDVGQSARHVSPRQRPRL